MTARPTHLVLSLSLPILAAQVGCSDDPSVSLSGKTPEQQADDVADAVCERNSACGEISISCDQEGCTSEVEPVDYQTCFERTRPVVLADLRGCQLQNHELRTVEHCLNALLAQDCPTPDEIDAATEAAGDGEEVEIFDFPAICEDAFAILEGCAG